MFNLRNNIPNLFSILRILLIPFIVSYSLDQDSLKSLIGASLFLFASLSDYLDGYLARRMKVVSNLGSNLDLLADKLLIVSTLALVSFLFKNIYVYIPVVIILFREVYITWLRVVNQLDYKSKDLKVNFLGKIKAAFQMISVFVLLLSNLSSPYQVLFKISGLVLLWIALLLTIISLLVYLVPKKRYY